MIKNIACKTKKVNFLDNVAQKRISSRKFSRFPEQFVDVKESLNIFKRQLRHNSWSVGQKRITI